MAVPCLRAALCLSLATNNLPSRAQVAAFVETLCPAGSSISLTNTQVVDLQECLEAGGQSVLPKCLKLSGQFLETSSCSVPHRARVD